MKLFDKLDYEDEYEDDEVIIEDPSSVETKNYTLFELLAGIIVFALIMGTFIMVVARDRSFCMKGFLIGIITAVYMVCHMNYTAARTLEIPASRVSAFYIKHYVIRLILVLAIMVLTFAKGWGDIVSTMVGIMSLKVAAYVQPFTHKLFNKIFNKGG